MALIDITPIMTSNTTPSPYIINASSTYSSSFSPYRAFDGQYDPKADAGWVTGVGKNVGEWISIDFGEIKKISMIKIGNYRRGSNVIKKITILGSKDGIEYNIGLGQNIAISYNPEDNEYATCNLGGAVSVKSIKIIITEVAILSDFTGMGEVKILLDDTISDRKERPNRFKTAISVDGYLEIKNTNIIPDTPKNGDIKLFLKDGKLYQIDDKGTESEVGSGSSISGKVVTGIERGQDKIVISFSDGTQEEVTVITDLTEVNEKIEKSEQLIEDLSRRSTFVDGYSGNFKLSKEIPIEDISSDDAVIFDDYSSNIPYGMGLVKLKKGSYYQINYNGSFEFSTPIVNHSFSIQSVETGEDISTRRFGSSAGDEHTTKYTNLSESFTYIPQEDCSIFMKIPRKYLLKVGVETTLDIVEIGKPYVVNPVKSVDEKDGIQDTPVGHVISHIGLTAPKHYLVCDGKEYNIVDYPKLAEHFLTHFGSYNYFGGDGKNTFAVPDMRGEFVRGYDVESVRDPQGATRGIGKHQDATKSPIIFRGSNGNFNTYDGTKDIMEEDYDSRIGVNEGKNGRKATTSSYDTAVENTHYTARPTNVNVLFCIKYEPTYYMEYHPKYATFETDVLFDGEIDSVGRYELASNINDYDFLVVESTKSETNIREIGIKKVTASSTYSSSYPPSNAIDGSKTTTWCSASQTGVRWFSMELYGEMEFDAISILAPSAFDGVNLCVNGFDVQISNDDIEWTTVHHIDDDLVFIADKYTNINLGSYYNAKYIRLYKENETRIYTYIAEIRVGNSVASDIITDNSQIFSVKQEINVDNGTFGDIKMKDRFLTVFSTTNSKIRTITGIKGTSDAFDIPTSDPITSDEIMDMIEDVWK